MKDLGSLKEHILGHVTLGSILQDEGLIRGSMPEEQLSCPFHGADNKKSARYYAETDSMYCWVCRIRWDLFRYVSQSTGMGFSEVLNKLVTDYRIDISSVPEQMDVIVGDKKKPDTPTVDQKKLYIQKLRDCVYTLRGKIEDKKYAALVYVYLIMKYATVDEKLFEKAEAMNAAINRVSQGLK